MTALNIRVNGVDQAMGAMRTAILQGATLGVEKLGLRAEQIVKQHTPVGATGNLTTDVFAELHQPAPNLVEIVSVHPPADVYSGPVETGTKPHFPPSSALVLWVKQKLQVGDEKQALSIAFAIAKTIAKRGTKGAHMFQLAGNQVQTEAPGIMEREIAAALIAAGFGGKSL
jgi:hypothetical protein